MWVIKIGGSLLGASELAHWLKVVTQYGDGKVVIVPGGGIFADAVRDAQQISHMSDTCAHKLAVRAMDQFACVLADMEPLLAKARNELELAERTWQHRGIVWLPSEMVLADTEIASSWDVTSDSIAAWLAHKLNAEKLILVKSLKPDARSTVQDLVQQDLVDKAFPDYIQGKSFDCWIVDKSQYTAFSHGFKEVDLSEIGVHIS
jgi:5-(aminomethyl)-3-furanmethanol phosphate kinase